MIGIRGFWVVLPGLLAACGGTGEGQSAGSGDSGAAAGYYEQSGAERAGRLCLIQRDGASGRFGVITWGRGDANCSGSGTVTRGEGRLTLLLDGDEACTIELEADGAGARVTRGLSGECARYYCAGGATLDGATFARSTTQPDASGEAKDLAGDPLCRTGSGN